MDGLTTRHLSVRRTARIAELGGEVSAPEEVWIVLHGYRQLAPRFMRRFGSLDDGRRRILAPEGLHRFYVDEDGGPHGAEHRVGASWMTREDRETDIADYLAYLDQVVDMVEGEVGKGVPRIVLGFSQGVHTAARWVVSGRSAPPRTTVLWGAGLPGDLDAERAPDRLSETRLVLVDGATDRHRPPAGRQRDLDVLSEWGVEAEALEHPGGHRIDPTLFDRITGLAPKE